MDSAAPLPFDSPLLAGSDVATSISRGQTKTSEAADACLAARTLQGDRAAFSDLIVLHSRTIYGYFHARVCDAQHAEDLCQEVFLRCFAGRHKLDPNLSAICWLLGIARNVLREHIRAKSKRREVLWTELCLEIDALVRTEDWVENARLLHLPNCLESLGPSARQAIHLQYETRLRIDQIAEKLSRSEGAVKLLVHRARQALRNCLERKRSQEHASK